MKVVIVGGGIGGLTAAVALQRQGIEVRVLEQVSTLHEAGAGLTLWPNAMRAFRQLGLADAIATTGSPFRSGGVRSWRGEILAAPPIDELERRVGEQGVAVHRAQLQRVLLSTLDGGMIQLDAECQGFEQDADGVTALLSNGKTEGGDVLIGADGIWSTVRTQLLGKTGPRYAGYLAWRGVAPSPYAECSFEAWGCGQRFGVVPIGGGQVYWYATANCSEAASARRGPRDELVRRFGGWVAPIPELLEATPEEAILLQPIYDRRPGDHWGQGRVTLLGDAAHPMTPNLGQGACQAVEDAVVLAAHLAQARDVGRALHTYEARRMQRTRTVVNLSWRIGKLGQLENPLLCWARDAAVKRIPRSVQLRQYAALFGVEAQNL
jgi:2-polyprenyl-6-methoxyphenol hydroxylase-like FAD-dependent oxidoreductase